MNKQEQLLDLCQRFIEDQQISCAEHIWQSDLTSESETFEFIEQICEIVGYAKCED